MIRLFDLPKTWTSDDEDEAVRQEENRKRFTDVEKEDAQRVDSRERVTRRLMICCGPSYREQLKKDEGE